MRHVHDQNSGAPSHLLDAGVDGQCARISYQLYSMIAYAIVRHHPDEKIIRAILSNVVDAPLMPADDDPTVPVYWPDIFRDLLEAYERGDPVDRACIETRLLEVLMEAGPCPRLLTMIDILQALDIVDID